MLPKDSFLLWSLELASEWIEKPQKRREGESRNVLGVAPCLIVIVIHPFPGSWSTSLSRCNPLYVTDWQRQGAARCCVMVVRPKTLRLDAWRSCTVKRPFSSFRSTAGRTLF
eukprot:scaffold5259_cov120-Cylindrotheca_fusiformis.AAC.6